jgi:chemotaxis protein methyltransferase CheR
VAKTSVLDRASPTGVSLTKKEFDKIRELAYEKFGLDLKEGKEGLVAARLGKRIREAQFGSFGEYYQSVVDDSTGQALIQLIDALATNHTSFLREPAHFEFLRETILPQLKSRRHVDIWCAAASTGEEPYTIAFSILDAWGEEAANRVRIHSTDISTKALDKASQAVYPADRFEALPHQWQRKYLLCGHGRWQGWYRVKPEVRAMVEYRRLNLIEPFDHKSPFALIFCRNVMIYFDKPTQRQVVNRMAEWLEPGGYLFTGHAESLAGLQQPLLYVQPAIYRKKPS